MFIILIYLFSEIFPGVSRGPSVLLAPGPIHQFGRHWRNCSSDGAERTDDGRAFHARAAVTGKARSPSLVRRVDVRT